MVTSTTGVDHFLSLYSGTKNYPGLVSFITNMLVHQGSRRMLTRWLHVHGDAKVNTDDVRHNTDDP